MTSYAIQHLVPGHLTELRDRRETLVQKVMAAVKDRLTKEINYWDHRANILKDEELAGKANARINSAKARQRADDLQARLLKRLQELEQERQLSARPPAVIGGALIVPIGMLQRIQEPTPATPPTFAKGRERVAALAMGKVMETERTLGREPRDIHEENRGYDIESSIPGTGRLLFIEVKGRTSGARTVTITRNEILTALNTPEDFVLAIVEVEGDTVHDPAYVPRPFSKEPDFGVTSVNYDLAELVGRAEGPR